MKFIIENWIYLGGLIALVVLFVFGMKHTLTLLSMQRKELLRTKAMQFKKEL